jgi:hypothetical protein
MESSTHEATEFCLWNHDPSDAYDNGDSIATIAYISTVAQ